jgi:ankyrin repeat protein
LHAAVIARHPAVVRALLAAGASPSRMDQHGRTPRQIATTIWRPVAEIVEALSGR